MTAPEGVHVVLAGRRGLATCPSCHHDDLAVPRWGDRLTAAIGRPRSCVHAVGDEISPLRNEPCGCGHPLHALGQRGKR